MSRYIRYKYQKQQINFLNCDDLNKWIDTCQTRIVGFDSVCQTSSCNCKEYGTDEYEPIIQYKKLNPNYNYECLDGNRHYRLLKQISYDNGISWFDTNEYQIGDVYEENSPWCNCGAIGCDNYISFRWSGDTTYFSINDSVPNKYVYVTVTKEDCIDNGDGTYTYRSNMRDIGVGDVTSLRALFFSNSELIEVYEIPKGDITNMNSMFIFNYNLKTFDKNILPNTSNVTDMSGMFNQCGLTSLDLSGIDTSNVTNMSGMFYYCSGLKSLDVSGWNISGVTSYSNMLSGCISLEKLIIGEVDEYTYNWWCARLTEVGRSCDIIISGNAGGGASGAGGGSSSGE